MPGTVTRRFHDTDEASNFEGDDPSASRYYPRIMYWKYFGKIYPTLLLLYPPRIMYLKSFLERHLLMVLLLLSTLAANFFAPQLATFVSFLPLLVVVHTGISSFKDYTRKKIIRVILSGGACIVLVPVVLFLVSLLVLPCLVLSFLVTRLLQFIWHGDAYDNVTMLKFCIRCWIYWFYLFSLLPIYSVYNSIFALNFVPHSIMLDSDVIIGGISNAIICSFAFSNIAFYFIPRVRFDYSESGLNVSEAVVEIADCLFVTFWFFLLFPLLGYKEDKDAGKLVFFKPLTFTTVIILYNVIRLVTYMMVWLLQMVVNKLNTGTDIGSWLYLIAEKLFRRKHLMYWANGMKYNINFVLNSLLLLLYWVFVEPKLEKTPQHKKVMVFGIWTCLSLLICAFLWLIKTCVILSWQAGSVYNRLDSKILSEGRQLYFLGIIGCQKFDIFNLLYYDHYEYDTSCTENSRQGGKWTKWFSLKRLNNSFMFNLNLMLFPTEARFLNVSGDSRFDRDDEGQNGKKLSQQKKKRAKKFLWSPTMMYDMQQAAEYFLTAKFKLSEEKYTSVILDELERYSRDHNMSMEDNLTQLIGEHEWVDFQDQLPKDNLAFETRLKTWMEMAHKQCLFLANTLSSAKEVVDCLDKIISWLLVFGTFIMWLLLTGLATTKVLVLIATPLLSVTFIFKESCKTLFEGIMFAYVVHPFNVGDLCVIGEKMMEVRTVGIWKTTFLKVGTQEVMIYPNSELSKQIIINYNTDFDWNDSVELDLDPMTKKKIKILKQEIEKYLDGNKEKFIQGSNSTEVLTTRDNIKLMVYFRHRVNLKNNTYFECLKEKRTLRSEFVLHAENLVDQYKNGG
ncbi:mechanosensitive ion channel protein 5 isoform X2 [Spinacia oleracea]|uniref:Mechanosensitive ion channel protein 5 isoform X2 n=1 Tax=Spinacia oleracea TaxID=3562 RepID=A0ABM3RSY1_SPIOL|nr:mechanosensitive ion channel protein 5-like isoform X2 [Spinacia oleracea]